MIEGRLQTSNWVGQDGQKRYRTGIVAENIQLGPRSANTSSEGSSYQSGNTPWSSGNSQKFTSQPAKAVPKDDMEEIPIINEDEPPVSPIISDSEIEEAEVDLKDIPF